MDKVEGSGGQNTGKVEIVDSQMRLLIGGVNILKMPSYVVSKYEALKYLPQTHPPFFPLESSETIFVKVGYQIL